MDFSLAAHRGWLAEVRDFLRSEFPPDLEAEARRYGGEFAGPALRAFRQKLAGRGWLAMTWPAEYGGLGRSVFEQFLLMDEFAYWGAPAIDLTVSAVAPTIMRHGSPAQQARWLPAILRGEVECAIGYSEPDAGSDLAAVRTSARRDGVDWVVTGQKLWSTGADHATHLWLLCRTDPDAPRHRGLSVLLLPLRAPGVTVQPIETWGGVRTTMVSLDGVRVGADHLVGQEGGGWRYVTMALDFERVSIGITGGLRRLYDELRRTLAQAPGVLGQVPRDVRFRLAELHARLERAKLLNYRAAWLIDQGVVPNAEASMTKVTTTELQTDLAATALQLLEECVGAEADNTPAARLAHSLYRQAPYLRFGGGTNEIQRDIIAQRGLGLPRAV